jgi:hypothetical protein
MMFCLLLCVTSQKLHASLPELDSIQDSDSITILIHRYPTLSRSYSIYTKSPRRWLDVCSSLFKKLTKALHIVPPSLFKKPHLPSLFPLLSVQKRTPLCICSICATRLNYTLYPAPLKTLFCSPDGSSRSVQKRPSLRTCSVCATQSNYVLSSALFKISERNCYVSLTALSKTPCSSPDGPSASLSQILFCILLCSNHISILLMAHLALSKNAHVQAHDLLAPTSKYVSSPSCSNETRQMSMALSLLCPKSPTPQPMERLCHFIASINICLEMADAYLYTTQQSITFSTPSCLGKRFSVEYRHNFFFTISIYPKYIPLAPMWGRAISKNAMTTPCVFVYLSQNVLSS